MTDLQAFYAKLDSALPDECRMLIDGRPVILSSVAYGKPYWPESRDEWLRSVESRVAAAIRTRGE
mgnify:CR=1 FL=1